MTREKFVARLLDDAGVLLAWAEVWAVPKPIGRGRSCPFWPAAPTQFVVTRDGVVSQLTIHWCDLDLARKTALPAQAVSVGQVFTFTWIEPVWLVSGMQDVPLPAVTVGSVAVGVPAGGIGVAG